MQLLQGPPSETDLFDSFVQGWAHDLHASLVAILSCARLTGAVCAQLVCVGDAGA
jgi:hypothetical protein